MSRQLFSTGLLRVAAHGGGIQVGSQEGFSGLGISDTRVLPIGNTVETWECKGMLRVPANAMAVKNSM